MKVRVVSGNSYETVAASQTAQVLGGSGAAGDYLSHVVVVPATAVPGVVTIIDNSTAVISYPGEAARADLAPFRIDIDGYSKAGAWKITTGANVSVMAFGRFT